MAFPAHPLTCRPSVTYHSAGFPFFLAFNPAVVFPACFLIISLPHPHAHDFVSFHDSRFQYLSYPTLAQPPTPKGPSKYSSNERTLDGHSRCGCRHTFGGNCHDSQVQGADTKLGGSSNKVGDPYPRPSIWGPLSTPEPKPLGGRGYSRETRTGSF